MQNSIYFLSDRISSTCFCFGSLNVFYPFQGTWRSLKEMCVCILLADSKSVQAVNKSALLSYSSFLFPVKGY